jgi:hypothetical protein
LLDTHSVRISARWVHKLSQQKGFFRDEDEP